MVLSGQYRAAHPGCEAVVPTDTASEEDWLLEEGQWPPLLGLLWDSTAQHRCSGRRSSYRPQLRSRISKVAQHGHFLQSGLVLELCNSDDSH